MKKALLLILKVALITMFVLALGVYILIVYLANTMVSKDEKYTTKQKYNTVVTTNVPEAKKYYIYRHEIHWNNSATDGMTDEERKAYYDKQLAERKADYRYNYSIEDGESSRDHTPTDEECKMHIVDYDEYEELWNYYTYYQDMPFKDKDKNYVIEIRSNSDRVKYVLEDIVYYKDTKRLYIKSGLVDYQYGTAPMWNPPTVFVAQIDKDPDIKVVKQYIDADRMELKNKLIDFTTKHGAGSYYLYYSDADATTSVEQLEQAKADNAKKAEEELDRIKKEKKDEIADRISNNLYNSEAYKDDTYYYNDGYDPAIDCSESYKKQLDAIVEKEAKEQLESNATEQLESTLKEYNVYSLEGSKDYTPTEKDSNFRKVSYDEYMAMWNYYTYNSNPIYIDKNKEYLVRAKVYTGSTYYNMYINNINYNRNKKQLTLTVTDQNGDGSGRNNVSLLVVPVVKGTKISVDLKKYK